MGNKQAKEYDNDEAANPRPVVSNRPISANTHDGETVVPAAAAAKPTNREKLENVTLDEKSKIPRDLFVKFINCLREMPFEITEDQFQDLANLLEIVSYGKGDLILEKGQAGKGIFLVTEGYCEVITQNDVSIRIIEDGDYFGEISTFYNRPCSANVIAGKDDTKVLMLPEALFDSLMQRPVDYPLIDLYIARRYLDLENTSMKDVIVKQITNLALIKAPPFFNWSAEAIDAIVNQVVPQNVICYPAGAHIFFADDVDSNGFLLMQGIIEIFGNNQEDSEVLNAGPYGLWFGDEQLFCPTKRQLTAKAHSPCIIAVLTAGNFQIIKQRFPVESSILLEVSLKWKKMAQLRDTGPGGEWNPGTEMLRLSLRKTQMLAMVPSGMIYILSLGIICRKLTNEQQVFLNNEQKDHLFIVFSGVIITEALSKVEIKKYESRAVFFPTENESDDLVVKAGDESLVGILAIQTFQEAQDMYPDAIINWESLKGEL